MMNIFDYLTWRGDLPLEASPFCEVDGAVLARISYLPLEHVMSDGERITLAAAAERMLALPDVENTVLQREDVEFMRALADTIRFGRAELFMCESRIDTETQTQFSAISADFGDGALYIAFRGTDNTLVGWKEDLNMGFVFPVPSQTAALDYTVSAAEKHTGDIVLAGHSKGGNLALYAAVFCPAEVQDRIRAVYNYDGPGFDGKVIDTDGYRRVSERVKTFVPQSSVVGMLLGHEEDYITVHSERVGIMQHDIYSWEVVCNRFVYLEGTDSSSVFVDHTLKAWIAGMDHAEREKFIDAIYNVITDTNASTLRDISENPYASVRSMFSSLKNLDEETRNAVTQALTLLLRSTKAGFTGLRESK